MWTGIPFVFCREFSRTIFYGCSAEFNNYNTRSDNPDEQCNTDESFSTNYWCLSAHCTLPVPIQTRTYYFNIMKIIFPRHLLADSVKSASRVSKRGNTMKIDLCMYLQQTFVYVNMSHARERRSCHRSRVSSDNI